MKQRPGGHGESRAIAQKEPPAGGQLMERHDAGIGNDPEEIRRAPLHQPVELRIGMKARCQPPDVTQRALVTLVAGPLEIDAVVFLEQRVAIEDGWIVDVELAFDPDLALVENLEALRGDRDGMRVAPEIRLGRLALEDCGEADGGALPHSPSGVVRLANAVGLVSGDVETEAIIGQRNLCGRRAVAMRLRPDEGEAF